MTTIETRMTEIQEMDLPALRDAWRRHYRVPPPRRLSRDLLMRAVAYKLQEQVHGGYCQVKWNSRVLEAKSVVGRT